MIDINNLREGDYVLKKMKILIKKKFAKYFLSKKVL